MKKLLTLLLIITLLAIASPVAAKSKQPIGDRINVYGGTPTEFREGAPFHIMHGWTLSPAGTGIGKFDFKLEVDGVYLKEDYVWRWTEPGDQVTLRRMWVFNFPDGMTGTHTFIGHWFEPCQGSACTRPNEKIETTRTLTVEFVP